ncbi:MAG: hypothetical protein HRT88_18180, partial [Lentisphaeraceae bacterium]|nr:hypothetical protein [Lentisphaeraceae bacterium]
RTTRLASYSNPAEKLMSSGKYRIEVKLKSAKLPVNLVNAIKMAGFDYKMTPKEVARRIVYGYEPEIDSLRYYSFKDEMQRQKITSNEKYRMIAMKRLKPKLAVVDEMKAKELIDRQCVKIFAEEIQHKRIAYIIENLDKISSRNNWRTSMDYKRIERALAQDPINSFEHLSTFIKKNFRGLQGEDGIIYSRILLALDKKERDKWLQFKFINIAELALVKNGLLIEKVAGHDVLFSESVTVRLD